MEADTSREVPQIGRRKVEEGGRIAFVATLLLLFDLLNNDSIFTTAKGFQH